MLTSNDFPKIVAALFDATYPCHIDMVSLSLIQPEIDTDMMNNTLPKGYNNHSVPIGSEVISRVESSPNAEGIMEMLHGVQSVTTDMVEGDDSYMNTTALHYLKLTSIAEIVYRNGVLILDRNADSVAMYDLLNNYITMAQTEERFSPHYIPPPQEDMNALIKLRNMLDRFSKDYVEPGQGDTAMAALIRMSTKVTTDKAPEGKLKFNGNTSNVTVGLTKKNPYHFN